MKYNKHMLELWKLTGKIGTLGEEDERYAKVYQVLSNALDVAELEGLISEEQDEYV